MACSVEVKNVVATFDLGRVVNCAEIAQGLSGRFDERVFPACVSYCSETKTSAQVFGTGRVVVVGCSTQDHGLYAALLLVHTLWRVLRMNVSALNFFIRNIVCSATVGHGMNLSLLYEDLAEMPGTVLDNARGEGGGQYEPERFPGISWAVLSDPFDKKSAVTFALFDSGKGVATGLRHMNQVAFCHDYISKLGRFRTGGEYRVQDPRTVRKRKAATSSSTKKTTKKQKTTKARLLLLETPMGGSC